MSEQNLNRLLEAVEGSDVSAVTEILRAEPSLAQARSGWEGQTPLHRAARLGELAVTRALLELGADVTARDGCDNATPLHWAADGGHLEVARLLVTHGADVDADDDAHGWGPLGWAMLGRPRPEVARYLLEAGARPRLFPLIALGDAAAVDRLLAEDPDALDERLSRFEHHEAPLHFAVAHGQAGVARVLIARGADPNGRNWLGLTPLAVAGFAEARAMDPILQDAGAVVDLTAALALGRWEEAEGLLSGSDELAPEGPYGRLLHFTAQGGYAEAARWLVGAGADVNASIDWWDNRLTALHPACSYGHLEVVRILIESGADPTAIDREFEGTPLDWARHYDRTEVVRFLEGNAG